MRSISPKLCYSEASLELASTVGCALQYTVGLALEPSSNLALLSYGEFDRRMKVAALPLDALVELARTHEVDGDDGDACEPGVGRRAALASQAQGEGVSAARAPLAGLRDAPAPCARGGERGWRPTNACRAQIPPLDRAAHRIAARVPGLRSHR